MAQKNPGCGSSCPTRHRCRIALPAQHRYCVVPGRPAFGAGIAATRRHGHVPGQGPGPQCHELFDPAMQAQASARALPWRPMCARDWSAWSSACITSPWSMRQARCRVLKPWCAGCIRSGAWCRRGIHPLSEQTGLIHSLGRLVLQAACAAHALGGRSAVCHWTLAVNVSAREFRHPDFVAAGARYPATDRVPTPACSSWS